MTALNGRTASRFLGGVVGRLREIEGDQSGICVPNWVVLVRVRWQVPGKLALGEQAGVISE